MWFGCDFCCSAALLCICALICDGFKNDGVSGAVDVGCDGCDGCEGSVADRMSVGFWKTEGAVGGDGGRETGVGVIDLAVGFDFDLGPGDGICAVAGDDGDGAGDGDGDVTMCCLKGTMKSGVIA